MNKELHRHDISDIEWEKIKPHTIGEKGKRAEMQRILGNSKMAYSGFFTQEPAGESHLQNMGIEKMFIADSVAGEIRAFGKIF